MSDLNALTSDGDGGLLVGKLGSTSIDSDGGFHMIVSPFRGPIGGERSLLPLLRMGLLWL